MADYFSNLPDDPEKAFLFLEKAFREECQDAVRNAGHEDNLNVYFVDYIAQVLGAIGALGLESAFATQVPKIQDVDYNTYLNFSKDVKHYTTQLEIMHARRVQGFSVRFDAAAKSKIHHFAIQIKEIIQKLELGDDKKEALFSKLAAFETEVDRDRTRLEAWGNFTIAVAGIVGEAAEQLEPMRKWVDSIAKLIWGVQSEAKQLPAPEERKRIEPPKVTSRSSDDRSPFSRDDMDDEIPF